MSGEWTCGHPAVGHNDGPCCAVCELGARVAALREAVKGLMEHRDCAFCDGGVLRKRVDGHPPFHADDCPWEFASVTMAAEARRAEEE